MRRNNLVVVSGLVGRAPNVGECGGRVKPVEDAERKGDVAQNCPECRPVKLLQPFLIKKQQIRHYCPCNRVYCFRENYKWSCLCFIILKISFISALYPVESQCVKNAEQNLFEVKLGQPQSAIRLISTWYSALFISKVSQKYVAKLAMIRNMMTFLPGFLFWLKLESLHRRRPSTIIEVWMITWTSWNRR